MVAARTYSSTAELVVKIELQGDPVNTTSGNGGYHELQRKLVEHFQQRVVDNSTNVNSIGCLLVDVGNHYHRDCQDDAD
jgi:hypothetical protein